MRASIRLGLVLLLLAFIPLVRQSGPSVALSAAGDNSLGLSGARPGNPYNGYVAVPYSPALNPSGGAITIEAWVKRNDASRCETLVGNGYQTSYWLGFCPDKLRFYPHGEGSAVDSNASVPAGMWTHVAVTYDGATRHYYINGVLDTTSNEAPGPLTPAPDGQPLGMGVDLADDFAVNYFDGLIDEVRIWNVARTPEQIRGGMFQAFGGPQPGLLAEWRFDGDPNDAVGGHNGQPSGLVYYSIDGAIPHDIHIPQAGPAPTLDGACNISGGEYAGAPRLMIGDAEAFLLHTTSEMWVCMRGLTAPANGVPDNWAAVYLDLDHSRLDPAQPDDLSLEAHQDGSLRARAGTGAGNYTATTLADGKWSGVYRFDPNTEFFPRQAEFRISADLLGGWGHVIGLALAQHWITQVGDDRLWPALAIYDQPSTWSAATLGAVGAPRTFAGSVVYEPQGGTPAAVPGVGVNLIGREPSGGEARVAVATTSADGSFSISSADDYTLHQLELDVSTLPSGYAPRFSSAAAPGVSVDARTIDYGSAGPGTYADNWFTLGDAINMRVTGIEVTQGIQNLSNDVPLIQNRRTFVRVYVKSDGAAVPGVTAQLTGYPGASNTPLGTLLPVNPVGTTIRVPASLDSNSRNDINQSFLFELPWSWTTAGPLRLTATLNPYRVPLEPNYGDNVSSVGPLTFKPSPRLSVQFFRLSYTISGTTYLPRITEDVLQTYSWIMRAYPIGGAIGQNFKPRLWRVDGGTKLGSWVNQSSPDCAKAYPKPTDDRSLCASYYTNGWLKYYRDHGWVPDTTAFYYGMISDGAAFPRGQALYAKTSVGPAGTPSGGWGWDTDGSYADWYAGHEIGHSLGRAHPIAGSDDPATGAVENCGHSRDDPNYPYGDTRSAVAPIGPPDGSMEGFDAGDPAFGIDKAVYPSAIWNDVMSYCSNQWVSDYTYTGMYNYMIAHPSLASAERSVRPAASGDFLSVAGVINPAENTAGFSLVRRLTTVANQPPLTPGDYVLRLLNAQNGVLADYAFTPNQDQESQSLGFDQVVNFVAGTRVVQIVKQNGGQVLASQPVSANPPALSNVALQSAPNPVSGVVTLGWTASDPDGDPLTFDIFYSRDNGATFQPAKMGATSNRAQIDTAQLGGSATAMLRVVASDGVNTAEASSAPFVMANKPTQPYILTPGDNTHIHYGQLINFSGMAFDAQDGAVGASGLVWTNAQGTTLGTGPLLSLDNLPVGRNTITLTASNSVGQSASASVTVIVDDDLNLPGPTLTAGPAQVGWQVSAGVTQAQTAQVSINNAGGGTLNWTASSDQPWLTLSATSGSVGERDPAALTLSANPSGLASGTTYSAKLTLSKPADDSGPAQTMVIPVSLSIGDVWNNVQPTGPITKIYLALVRR